MIGPRLRQIAGMWRLSLAMAVLCGLAGCETGPKYPLLSPVAVTGSFGYSDASLADDRYAVNYVTPVQISVGYSGPGSLAAEAQRRLGFDMTLWRAAQISQTRGYPGFHITDRRSDLTSLPDPADYFEAYDCAGWGGWRHWGGWGGWGRHWHDPPCDPWGLAPRLDIQAHVSLDIQLVRQLQAGDYEAASAIQQLRATYPGGDAPLPPGSPVPAPQPAGPGTVTPYGSPPPAIPPLKS